jgi:hypothetical protein
MGRTEISSLDTQHRSYWHHHGARHIRSIPCTFLAGGRDSAGAQKSPDQTEPNAGQSLRSQYY